jgi:photosystem II stability/assembly factor-like uncharacterized protein
MKKFIIVFLLQFFIFNYCVLQAQWIQTGPYGGTVSCLGISGSNLLAGGAGIYLSTNNGTSWDLVNNGLLQNMSVAGICVSGTNIFALTIWDGVFLSTDNGTSWTKLGFPLIPYALEKLAVFEPNIWVVTGEPLIYVSTNNGVSWGLASTPFSYFTQIIKLSSNLYAGTSSGIFISTNNGTNWSAINNGLPTNKYVSSLVSSGTSIFAGMYNAGVFMSTNNGTDWVEVNNGLTDLNVHALAVSGTNIFAGTFNGGVFLSTNNGTNWSATNNGLPTGNSVNTITVSGANIFTTFEGDGIFLSTNNGSSWAEVNSGISNRPIVSLAVSGASIYVGDVYGSLFYSENNGNSWARLNLSLDHLSIATDFVNIGSNLFVGTRSCVGGEGIFLSTNNGTNWTTVNNGWPRSPIDTTRYACVSCLATRDQNLFAATWDLESGIYISTNNGTSWTPVNNGLAGTVYAISVFDTNIFAGSIYLSTNNGTNWFAIKTGLPENTTVNAFTISGINIFAGTYGDGVFLSTNNGTNWTAVNNGLPRDNMNPDTEFENINCITSYSNNIFAGTDGKGIFLSTNNGDNWTEANTGLNKTGIRSLDVSDSYIFAGTEGGVWRRSLSEFITDVENLQHLPTRLLLKQNYPNPFNCSSIIKYSIPKFSQVTLKILNTLGEEIETLVNEEKPVGNYELTWNAANMPSGVYFYRLQAGDFVQTKKMILLK